MKSTSRPANEPRTRPGHASANARYCQLGQDIDSPRRKPDSRGHAWAVKSASAISAIGAPNARSACMTRAALSGAASIQTSRSPVALGFPCRPRATRPPQETGPQRRRTLATDRESPGSSGDAVASCHCSWLRRQTSRTRSASGICLQVPASQRSASVADEKRRTVARARRSASGCDPCAHYLPTRGDPTPVPAMRPGVTRGLPARRRPGRRVRPRPLPPPPPKDG